MSNHSSMYEEMHDPHIMLTFKGSVTYDLVNALLNSIEPRLHNMEKNIPVRKKLYNILVECLQNVVHHGDEVTSDKMDNSDKVALLLVTSDHDSWCIQTGNTILNGKVKELEDWLEVVNTLSAEELKEAYKKILNEGELSQKGTAGLGFIDIARKSGQRLKYAFQKMNDEYSIFSFIINIPKSLKPN